MRVSSALGRGASRCLMAAIIWGAAYPATKIVLAEMNVLQFIPIKFGLGTALMFAALRASGADMRVDRSGIRPVFIVGLIGVAMYHLLWTYGVMLVPSAVASLIMCMSPVFANLYSVFSGAERLSPRRWLGMAVAASGVLIIVGIPDITDVGGIRLITGVTLLFAAALTWATFSILSRPLLSFHSPLKLLAWADLCGLSVIIPVCLMAYPPQRWSMPSAPALVAMAFIIVVVVVISFILWYQGVKLVGPAVATLFQNMVPVSAMVMSFIIMGDTPTASHMLGAGTVFAGLAVATVRNGKKAGETRPA